MSPDFVALLKELRGKDLITEQDLQRLQFMEENERTARIRLFGYLDALVDGNSITHQQAEPYIERLGISGEDMENMRAYHREKEEQQKRIN